MQQPPVDKPKTPNPPDLGPDFTNIDYITNGEFGYVWR